MDVKKSVNQVLAEMDDLPETMSVMAIGVSSALVGRSGRKQGPHPEETIQRMKAAYAARPAEELQEIAAKISKGNSAPCTVDGITIYPSLTELVRALGMGKKGRKHPNFQYVGRVPLKRGAPAAAVAAKMGARNKGRKLSPEALAKRGDGPCTIDGITIYTSKRAMTRAIGRGKTGANHPNFRYVGDENDDQSK